MIANPTLLLGAVFVVFVVLSLFLWSRRSDNREADEGEDCIANFGPNEEVVLTLAKGFADGYIDFSNNTFVSKDKATRFFAIKKSDEWQFQATDGSNKYLAISQDNKVVFEQRLKAKTDLWKVKGKSIAFRCNFFVEPTEPVSITVTDEDKGDTSSIQASPGTSLFALERV